MSRAMRVPLSDSLVTVKKGNAAPALEPHSRARSPEQRKETMPVKRIPMTFRLTEAAYEQLRERAFKTRVSQQALVDQALEQFLSQDHG